MLCRPKYNFVLAKLMNKNNKFLSQKCLNNIPLPLNFTRNVKVM